MDESLDAYRTIRRVAPPETPHAGRLVSVGDSVQLLVPTDSVGSAWPGWRRAVDDHLLAPLDIARTDDGHDIVLPWCRERVDRYLAGRERPLGGGEAVTLLVSLLRAIAAARVGLGRTTVGPLGVWWLTDAGRPVFCEGNGESIERASSALARHVGEAGGDRVVARLALEMADTLPGVDGAAPERLRDWEHRLFVACAPQPLADEAAAPSSLASESVPRLGAQHAGGVGLAVGLRPASRVEPAEDHDGGLTAWAANALRRVAGAVERRSNDRVSDDRLGRPSRAPRRHRGVDRAVQADARVHRRASRPRAPLVVGGLAAACVLTIGMIWPV